MTTKRSVQKPAAAIHEWKRKLESQWDLGDRVWKVMESKREDRKALVSEVAHAGHKAPPVARVPKEPEELGLWREVAAYRDLLVSAIEGGERSARDGQISERTAAEYVRTARARLRKLDAQICKGGVSSERPGNRGRAYGGLKKLAQSFHDALMRDAYEQVRRYFETPELHTWIDARAAILRLKEAQVDNANIARWRDRVRDDPDVIDMEALETEARKRAAARKQWGGPQHLAKQTIAHVTGLTIDSVPLKDF